MPKTIKRIFAIMLVILMLLQVVSCNGGNGDKNDKNDNEHIASDRELDEPYDVNFYFDEHGEISWDPIDGAMGGYYFVYYNENGDIDPVEGYCHTQEPRAMTPDGWGVRIWPTDENGYFLCEAIESDIWYRRDFSEPNDPSIDSSADSYTPPSNDDVIRYEREIIVEKEEGNFVSWFAVEDAIAYEYVPIDPKTGEYEIEKSVRISETEFVFSTICDHAIRAVFLNDEYSPWIILRTMVQEPQELEVEISVDENGLATWNEIEGATEYKFNYYCKNADSGAIALFADDAAKITVRENGAIQLYKGYGLYIQVELENSLILTGLSEIYGDPSDRDPLGYDLGYISPRENTICWEETLKYELISNIRYDTVTVAADGSVTFEANGPKGETLRFYGHGVKIEEGKITLAPKGFLTALDAIGRIFAQKATVSEKAGNDGTLYLSGGYTFSDKTSVESYRDLTYTVGYADYTAGEVCPFEDDGVVREQVSEPQLSTMVNLQPNFPTVNCPGAYSEHPISISEWLLYYLDDVYTTDILSAYLNSYFYGSYLEGDRYNASRESSANEAGISDFYLLVIPDVDGRKVEIDRNAEWDDKTMSAMAIYTVTESLIDIGDLRDKNGNVLDKNSDRLTAGSTIDITIGKHECKVKLPVVSKYKDANTMHELVPYAFPEAKGTINTLVIPIGWRDEPEHADDDEYARFLAELGRVIDAEGNVHDYSDALGASNRFSLSRYYDVASLGALKVQSFMTEWYMAPYDFADMKSHNPDQVFTNELLDWLYATHPDMDWTQFDKDGNGYFDAVILLNAGEVKDFYNIISFSGGIMTRYSYTGEFAGSPERPSINCFTNVNIGMLDSNVIIHEYAHNLGLIDYYDVTYSGIDAVGHFDMQSSNAGDWNSYSKYAAGWIRPEIVTGLAKGESVDIEIGAAALTGDAIVVPGATSDYNGTPFDEYILIDLFTADGVNCYAAENYGLHNTTGVRIYHINATMEKRELTVDGKDEIYPIGTPHVANAFNSKGEYHVELIQAGKNNTFTDKSDLRTNLLPEDLFGEGDLFTVEAYSDFFIDGALDDETEFGYIIEIINITEGENATATVRITRQ